jgi:hypothetical protein
MLLGIIRTILLFLVFARLLHAGNLNGGALEQFANYF